MTVVVLVVAVVVLLSTWVTWTAGRLDRLSARVESAWAALDAQLVRRAAAATELAAHLRRNRLAADDPARTLERTAAIASQAAGAGREPLENDLSRVIHALVPDLAEPTPGSKTAALLETLEHAATRVGFARQFYNDAVRDDRRLRRRWLPRLLTVRHRHERRRDFFEIDDTAFPVRAPDRPYVP